MSFAKKIFLSDRVYATQKSAFVMGIINATSDSFYDSSRISCVTEGVEKALKMIEDGADILDIGAESSRPGSDYVSEDLELQRLVPLVEKIRCYNKNVPISIDTRKKTVIESCVNAGADILNDISCLEDDDEMAKFVAESKIPVILMHKRGNPKTMQENTQYFDAVKEVSDYLYARADFCVANGIAKNKLIFDVGLGFGKNLEANLQLLKNCVKIARGYDDGKNLCLVALSRKSMIGQMTDRDTENRLSGTLAAESYAILSGCDIIRCHDTAETVDIVNVLTELMNERI